MAWTSPSAHIFAVAEVVSAATMNTYIQSNLGFLGTPPSVQVFNTTVTTVPTSTNTIMPFNNERFKTDAGMHSNVTNNDRIICTVTGKYAITASIEWAANNTGVRGLLVVINTSNIIAAVNQQACQGGPTQQNVSTIYGLNATDFIDIYAVQTSGANINIDNVVNSSPWAAMNWIGF